MKKTAMVRARTFPELKEAAESIFETLGLSQTEAINMFYKQVVLHRGLPFDVRVPNKQTIKAIQDARAQRGSLYDDVDDLFEDL